MASTIATNSAIALVNNWAARADGSTPGAGNPGYVTVVGSDNKLHVYKCTDAGTTWVEQDSANAPAVSANTLAYSTVPDTTFIYTIRHTATGTINCRRFDKTTDTWEASELTPDISTVADGSRNNRIAVRGDGDVIFNYKRSDTLDPYYRRWDGSALGSQVAIFAIDGHPMDTVVHSNGNDTTQYYHNVSNNDATYRNLSSADVLGTDTDFDATINTNPTLSALGCKFFDGTVWRMFFINRDTTGEIDGYVATEGATVLGTAATISSVSTSTTIDPTSIAATAYGGKLYACWADTNHDVFYDQSTSLTTLTFGADDVGPVYAADPCPQWLLMGDGLGILCQSGTTVEVTWLFAPSAGGTTVNVPTATATGDASAPTIRATSAVPVATATATAPAPSVLAVVSVPVATVTGAALTSTIRALVAVPVATATGDAVAPTVQSAGAQTIVSVPVATATGTALAPTVRATVPIPQATATGTAAIPTVRAVVAAPVATGSGAALTPTVPASLPPVAVATGAASTPSVRLVIAVPVATALGAAPAPSVLSGAGQVAPPVATATGAALVPTIRLIASVPPAAATGNALAPTPAVLIPAATAAAFGMALAPTTRFVILPPPANATGQAFTPTYRVFVPVATATGVAMVPNVVIGALPPPPTPPASVIWREGGPGVSTRNTGLVVVSKNPVVIG